MIALCEMDRNSAISIYLFHSALCSLISLISNDLFIYERGTDLINLLPV